jgi:hypothetical protein
MAPLPDLVTHNYDPAHGPFRNLCTLPDGAAQAILDKITASGTRRIKADYLARRLITERWLRTERERKLGTPKLSHPIYFFLGDFADGRDQSRPRSIRMPLAAFSRDMVTFTYPDSMASLPLAGDEAHDADRRPYHGQVFTLDEIAEVVAKFGLPSRQAAAGTNSYDRFIEMQVWDDGPLRRLLVDEPAF